MKKANDGGEDERVGRGSMGAFADVATAGGMVTRLEDLEAARCGVRVDEIRMSLARKVGTTPSTLANIRRQRRKFIPSWLMAAIRNALIAALQHEVRALEHDIEIARRVGLRPDDDTFIEAQIALTTARNLLEGAAQAG